MAGVVRSADSVQVCPVGPTCGGRLLSGLRRTVVSKEEISRCFGGNIEAGSHMQTGRPSPNARGPATCLQTVAPTGISRRDSFPPLNAMPVVQVPQAERRVLRKRDVADSGRPHAAPPAVADACPACAGQACQRNRFSDVGGEVSGERGPLMEECPGTLVGKAAPINKSFRKEDGGAGEGGKPFFKRVSSFPRISPPLSLSS